MKNQTIYGFQGFYGKYLLDIQFPTISEEEIRHLKISNPHGFRIENANSAVITLFKKSKNKKQTAELNISAVCCEGKGVSLFLLETAPLLFVYTDEQHYGLFTLPTQLLP